MALRSAALFWLVRSSVIGHRSSVPRSVFAIMTKASSKRFQRCSSDFALSSSSVRIVGRRARIRYYWTHILRKVANSPLLGAPCPMPCTNSPPPFKVTSSGSLQQENRGPSTRDSQVRTRVNLQKGTEMRCSMPVA